jgi:uncharacterized protein
METPSRSIRQWLKPWMEGLSFPAVFVLVFSTLLLILFHENCSTSVFGIHFAKYFPATMFSGLYSAFFWYGCSFVVLGVVPFVFCKTLLRREVPDFGTGLGDWKFGLAAVLTLYFAFLPVLVAVSYTEDFQSKYPLFSEVNKSALHFIVYQAAYAIYFIGWEFVFRGFMLFGLKPALGFYAVFIQTIPFAVMHFGKPQAETISAVFAGVLLGYLAIRARSFWYGWLLHSLIAITNDVLACLHKSSFWHS